MRKAKVETEEISQVEASEEKVSKTKQKTVNKVGSLLKEMRMEKGLRIPDISKKLCIRKIYLEAIEESNYDEIPAFPYGVGFIRSYAEYLGLNSSNIVELYKEETNSNPNKNIYVLEPQSEATVPNRKYLLISLLGIVLVYVLWQVYNNKASEEVVATEVNATIEEAETEQKPIVVEEYAIIENVEETADDVNSANMENQISITEEEFVGVPENKEEKMPEKAKSDIKDKAEEVSVDSKKTAELENGVVIKIKEETWLEIKDQNKLYISKVLQPGAEYVVPEGGKGMIFSIGKVNGADVYINGKLTPVARTNKKTNIPLDPFLSSNH